jgi:hypothetical protein
VAAKKKPESRSKPLVGIEILTWTEGVGTKQVWLAAWKRFDLLTQGPTEKKAVERLFMSIATQAIWEASDGNLKTFGSCKKPPRNVLKEWRKAHNTTHINDES